MAIKNQSIINMIFSIVIIHNKWLATLKTRSSAVVGQRRIHLDNIKQTIHVILLASVA
jgi:hypothetical protein